MKKRKLKNVGDKVWNFLLDKVEDQLINEEPYLSDLVDGTGTFEKIWGLVSDQICETTRLAMEQETESGIPR